MMRVEFDYGIWPSVFKEEVRGQRKSDAASGN
jgi:hypothetical protein